MPRSAFDPARPARLALTFAEGDAAAPADTILGTMRFGAAHDAAAAPDWPFAALHMPALGPPYIDELWACDRPARYYRREGAKLAAAGDLLFGALDMAQAPGVPLEDAARALYDRLFRLLAAEGYAHLWRIWNYFPDITQPEGELERYRRFTVGRHDSYLAQGRAVEHAPAASALGCRSGPLTLVFLAAKTPGQPIENPRQISAYRYPERYGPRSPTFSRALMAASGGEAVLFISGTASIVGHESLHPGDPAAQAAEALTNIRALIAQAQRLGLPARRRLMLKAYLRDGAMLDAVRPVIAAALGPQDSVVYLAAEICRPELLVEIEGACL